MASLVLLKRLAHEHPSLPESLSESPPSNSALSLASDTTTLTSTLPSVATMVTSPKSPKSPVSQSPNSNQASSPPAPVVSGSGPTPLGAEEQNAAGLLPASHWTQQPVSHGFDASLIRRINPLVHSSQKRILQMTAPLLSVPLLRAPLP